MENQMIEKTLKDYEKEIMALEYQLDSIMNRILKCLGIARKLQAGLGYEQKTMKRWVAKRPYKKRKGE